MTYKSALKTEIIASMRRLQYAAERLAAWAEWRANRLEYPKRAAGTTTCITDYPPNESVRGAFVDVILGEGRVEK